MRTTIKDWKNGWFGVEIGIAGDEIDGLMNLLQMLKDDPDQHFHVSSDYKGEGGVGEITFYVQPSEEDSNADLSGLALAPGEEIDDRSGS